MALNSRNPNIVQCGVRQQ